MKKFLPLTLTTLLLGLNALAASLQWDANDPKEGVKAYFVYQTAPTSQLLGSTTGTSFVITPSITPVSYAVAASNVVGLSELSASITPPIAPVAPAGLTFQITRNPQSLDVVLSWSAATSQESISSYNIYELVLGVWVSVGSSPTNKFTVAAATLSSHTYCIKAVNMWGESPQSVSVITPPIPSTPSGLKISVN